MGSSGNGGHIVVGLRSPREQYLDLLQKALNDLDENSLTDLPLLHRFDAAEESLMTSEEDLRSDRELSMLVGEVTSFLAIVIQSMSSAGEQSLALRKSINERLSALTEGSYEPIFQPA